MKDQPLLPTRGPRATTILLVFLASLLTGLAVAAVGIHASYREVRHRLEQTRSLVAERSAEAVRGHLAEVRAELARIAERADPRRSDEELQEVLATAFASSRTASALLALDPEGRIRARVGSGPDAQALSRILDREGARDGDLVDVINAASRLRELAAVRSVSIRVAVAEGEPSLPIASTPLAAGGEPSGSLHLLLEREGLAARLRPQLQRASAVTVVDAEGGVLAAVGETEPPRAVGLVGSPLGLSWLTRSTFPVEDLGMEIVVERPMLGEVQPMLLAALRIAGAGLAAVALCTVLASWALRGTSASLRELFEALQRVTRKEPDVSLPEERVHGQIAVIFRAFNAMVRSLREERVRSEELQHALAEQNRAFQRQHDLLKKLSVTDGLTQLHNHRFFQDQLVREIKRLARTQEGLSILIVDIDDFKQLNDQYGHAAGDEALKQLAQILKESVRETDLLARYGGEEFVIVATGTPLEGATVLAEKLRMKVEQTSFIVDDTMRPRRVTVSVGVAQYRRSRTELFTAADAALYRAKAAGKNCVMTAEATPGAR